MRVELGCAPAQLRPMTVPSSTSGKEMNVQRKNTTRMVPESARGVRGAGEGRRPRQPLAAPRNEGASGAAGEGREAPGCGRAPNGTAASEW